MRITARITLGYGIIIILLAASTFYQLSANRRLVTVIGSLSGVSQREVTANLQLMSDRDRMEESLKRFLLNGSAEDSAQLKEATEDIRRSMDQIRAGEHPQREQLEINRLVQFWNAYSNAVTRIQPARAGESQQVPGELQEPLDQLRIQIQTLYQLSRDAVTAEAEKGRDLAKKSEIVLLSMGVLVVLASALSAFLVIRSISVPLVALLQGARAITEGKSFYRLDTSRNDELSQLAKVFNDLRQRATEPAGLEKEQAGD
jgi:CHASE3 domain sensor protein